MTTVLAIDPGSIASGWVRVESDTGSVRAHGKSPNDDLLAAVARDWESYDVVVIEFMSPRGMPTSAQEMEALWWAGRFAQAAQRPVHRITRDTVKYHLTGRRAKVNDAAIRAVLIDRYGGIGGKDAAIGRKAAPGPLHGVTADAWAALALACAWIDGAETVDQYRARKAAEAA